MASCQVYRDNGEVTKVLAKNGQPSILYEKLVEHVQKTGSAKLIKQLPYLQQALSEGSILGATPKEVALGMWSIAYTDAYSTYFDRVKAVFPQTADKNGEPLPGAFLAAVTGQGSQFQSPAESYVLSDQRQDTINNSTKRGNPLQQRIADALVVNPVNPVILEPISHVYTDVQGNEYVSTTTAIKGPLVDKNDQFEINRKYGNAFDRILEGIINGEDLASVSTDEKVLILEEDMKKQAYNVLSAFVNGITSDGSIIIPQVMLGDPTSRIAGSLDVLVIKPNGLIEIIDLKVSKNSVTKDSYASKSWDTNPGSKIGGKLTTQQQHGIQVAVYKKLVELQGFRVSKTETVHIKLNLDVSNKIQDFTWEGSRVHSPSANESLANKVVETEVPKPHKLHELKKLLGLDNPAADPDFLTEDEAKPEEDEPEGDLFDRIKQVAENAMEVLQTRRKYFETIKDNKSFKPKKDTVMALNKLVVEMEDFLRLQGGKPHLAYGAFLTHVDTEVQALLNFIVNPASKSNSHYAGILIEGDKFIESYRGLIKAQYFGSKEQQNKLIKVIDLLDGTQEAIREGLEDHVKNLYKSHTTKNVTQEELDSIMENVLDISQADYALGDIATSTNPLLATVDMIVKNAIQTSRDRTDTAIDQIKAAGLKLLKASGVRRPGLNYYDFMKVFTKDGKFTGRYVTNIGQQYWDLYYKHRNALKEKNGDPKQYIPISDWTTADPEDIKYNQELFAAKQANRAFLQAEYANEFGVQDGKYHQYTEKFKRIRDQYEELVEYTNFDGKKSFRWAQKTGIPNTDYKLYRAQYYKQITYWGAMIESDGTFKGRVELKDMEVPKEEFSEIRERASDGTDMRDPKYVKLVEPKTPLEVARSEFYHIWVKQMNETLSKLDPAVAKQMRGKFARYRGAFIDNLKKNGEGFLNVIGKSMRNMFRAEVYTDQRVLDEDGSISNGIPVTFVGKLQSPATVARLKKKLEDLNLEYSAKRINRKDYLAERKKYTEYLRIEEGKLSADEIESDVVDNLIAFRQMAENFEAMSNVESDIKAIRNVIEKSTFVKEDVLGRPLVEKGTRTPTYAGDKVTFKGEDSLTARRLKKYLEMVFYNDDEMNRTTMAMIAQRFQNLTSLKGIGFNVFGNLNNYVMGRINNSIEAWGGQHFKTKALHRANVTFNKEHLPGWFANVAKGRTGKYDQKNPGSKYEALVNHFRIVRKHQADSGRIDVVGWAYMMQEGGEYNVQSKTGIAVLMSEELTNSKTGETESIYDAFVYNPNTGELKLKDGYELPDNNRHKVTNRIYEINKLIHGNYQFEDRMVIQYHWLGQLAAQFHKWVYPSFKARFKPRYYDQNLGEIEGRYLTVWKLIAYMRETEGNILDKMRGGWQNLDAAQIANLRKNLAELTIFMTSFMMYNILSALGKGVDDDDENLKKAVNFLTYQQSRQMQEIVTMVPGFGIREQFQIVKNPIAVLGTAKDFGDIVFHTLRMPFPPYEKNFYDRGIHKDDLKLWKEVKDATPALNILNKWDAFEQVKSFYIK